MNGLIIIVCLKQVPDPEGPAASFKIDAENKKVVPVGIPPVINPFDQNALEVAFQLKKRHGGRIIGISAGDKLARPVLSRALAAGADQLVLLEDILFKDIDSFSMALILAGAIKKLGEFNIILTGRQAGDWDSGQTGIFLAENLQIAAVSFAQKVEIQSERVIIERLKHVGYDVVESSMPVLVTVSSEAGEPHNISFADIKSAREKPVITWSAADLGIDPLKMTKREIYSLTTPSRHRNCRIIEGDQEMEKGEALAKQLRDDGLI